MEQRLSAVPTPGQADAQLHPRVLASWQRSEQYGVPLDEVEPAFAGSLDTESLLFECGTEVLAGLQSSLGTEPVSLMLTDSAGLVLDRWCGDSGILRALDRVYLAPGFSYAERDAGTNGLGLALADRAPSLVRGNEHYCATLRRYTCAAAPVQDLATGAMLGSVNLTTWSDSSSELLLALAKSAAGNTAALMLARSAGRTVRPPSRGEVFHLHPGLAGAEPDGPRLSRAWEDATEQARRAIERGRVVAVVGEPGAGKAALAALARRRVRARERVLNARPPQSGDLGAWLALWTPELDKADTCVVISSVDRLPAWAAERLAPLLAADRTLPPFVLTAEDFSAIPEPLCGLVDSVAEAPTLRSRANDVLPLARHFAYRERRRPVNFTPAAERALTGYCWPENVRQLRRVIRDAAARTDVIDTRHLSPEIFSAPRQRLTRMQTLERDEIARCLSEPGITVAGAAAALGLSRATLYRKMARYDITAPGRPSRP